MEKSFLILSVLMLTLINFVHVPSFILVAQADINIICGATDAFTDSNGNQWVGDYQLIGSGSTAWVQFTSPRAPFLSTVRYFPYGSINCYRIPGVTQGNKIQVLAIFQYGNYDNWALPPSFGLKFDGSNWAEVQTSMDLVGYGMTYWAVANTVSVCLAPDSTARAPFISAIQIMEAPPSPSTESPPSPSTESSPPNPSTVSPTIITVNVSLAPPNASANASPKPKGLFGGFIYLVTLLPGGTLITIIVSVIACITKRKKNKKADVNINLNVAGAANQQKSDTEDKSKDEVQETDN